MQHPQPIAGTISARVYRCKKKKPALVPTVLWRWAQKNRLSWAGNWEDLGIIGQVVKENRGTIN